MMDANRFAGFGNNNNNKMGADSPNGRNAGDAPRKQKPLRPVTIRQLLTAQRVGDGALVIDGQEAGQVTIVGVVLKCDVTDGSNGTTQHQYKVSDGTGIITVRTWTSEKPAETNTYIRASGNVGSFQNSLNITGMVRAINNTSEVPYHQMDCILTHLRITQGTKSAGYGATQQQQQQQHQQHPNMHAQPYANHQQHHQQQPQQPHYQQQVYGGAAPAAAPQHFGGSPRDVILGAIRSAGPSGATVQGITEAVRAYGLQGEVRDVIRSLNAEGTVFTQNNTIYLSMQK